jgi:hypothetical protein
MPVCSVLEGKGTWADAGGHLQFYRTFAARIIEESGRCPSDEGARTTAYMRPKVSPGGAGTIECPTCGRRWGGVTFEEEESTQNAGRPPICDIDSVRN